MFEILARAPTELPYMVSRDALHLCKAHSLKFRIFHFSRRTVLETNPQAQPQPQRQDGVAPQPGAVPQAPAAGGGRIMRFLGRFFGVPVQPPPAPGQFGRPDFRMMPPNAPVPPAWPAPGQVPQPGVWYQVPPPPQYMQPPPPFRGFYGPGGAWEQWPAHPQWAHAGQIPPQDQQQPQRLPPPPGSPLPAHDAHAQPNAAGVTPTPTIPSATAETSAPLPPSTTAPAASTGSSQPGQSPKEAAALAALRRTNANTNTSSASTMAEPRREDLASQQVTDAHPQASTSTQSRDSDSSSLPSQSTSTAGTSSTTSSAAPGSSIPINQPNGTGIPSLIPVYDFPTQPPRGPMYPYSAYNGHAGSYPQHGAWPGYRPPVSSRSTQTQGGAYRGSQSSSSSRYSRAQAGTSTAGTARTPLTQLPPTLTDEQLSRLDRLTRDAIEERLRVLEGVSGAVWRCIEELTRVRSALPVSSTSTATTSASGTQATSTPTPGASTSATTNANTNGAKVNSALSEPVTVVGSPVVSERSSSDETTSEEITGSNDPHNESAADGQDKTQPAVDVVD